MRRCWCHAATRSARPTANAWTGSACLLCISSLMGPPLGGIYFSLQRRRIFHLPLLFAPRTSSPAPFSRHRPPPAAQTLLLTYEEGRVTFYRQSDGERVDTPALRSLVYSASFTINVSLWHFAASQPVAAAGRRRRQGGGGGGGGWRSERDYDRHGMKVLRRKKEESGEKIKLLLSELARSEGEEEGKAI